MSLIKMKMENLYFTYFTSTQLIFQKTKRKTKIFLIVSVVFVMIHWQILKKNLFST
jgi:hypothetical protein